MATAASSHVAASPQLQQRQHGGSFSSESDQLRLGLSTQELTELRATFDLFDTAGTSHVDPQKMLDCLLDIESRCPNGTGTSSLRAMVVALERLRQSDSWMTFDQFVEIVGATQKSGLETRNDLAKAFRLFDTEGSGVISADQLHRVCAQLGEKLSWRDIHELIRRADRDGDGYVTFDDFCALLLS